MIDETKITARLAKSILAARGQQVRRKDKDLMEDTGGVSKGRDREPNQKPPRDDVKKRYRTKRKKKEDKDPDIDVKEEDKHKKKSSLALTTVRGMLASMAEKQFEKLMLKVIPDSPFRGKAFAVGGYVRDEVLGIGSKDLDITVEMRDGARKLAEYLHKKFKKETSRARQLGAGYPIWSITFKEDVEYEGKTYKTDGAVIEFADTQTETFPDPDSRQRVTEHGTLKQDVERRDFTVNMLMKDMGTGELKDLAGTSLADLKKGILRGHPGVDFAKIISEDPLRMMRLIRFQVKYGWKVPLSVMRTVKQNAAKISKISGERIRDELIKIMKIGKLAKAIKLMKVVGLLKHIIPEVEELEGTMHDTSRGVHQEGNVFKHTYLVVKGAKPNVEAQLSALLHDIGKPATISKIGEKIQFLKHEDVGAGIAEAIMFRLKFDRSTIKTVKKMVELHMKPHGVGRGEPTDKALRRFIRTVGDEMVDAVLDLAEADALGNLPQNNYVPELRKKIEAIRNAPVKMKEKTVLDGNAILRILGVKPGPIVGEAILFLKDLEDDYASKGQELTEDVAEKALTEQFAK